jgi:hypothetical protein
MVHFGVSQDSQDKRQPPKLHHISFENQEFAFLTMAHLVSNKFQSDDECFRNHHVVRLEGSRYYPLVCWQTKGKKPVSTLRQLTTDAAATRIVHRFRYGTVFCRKSIVFPFAEQQKGTSVQNIVMRQIVTTPSVHFNH